MRDGPSTYRFSHDIVREIVYGALATADRVRLHRKAADSLALAFDAVVGDA